MYADKFVTRITPPPPPHEQSSVFPSYSVPSSGPATTHVEQAKPSIAHVTAIREAFIENWKSDNFGRFVDACRTMVDELVMVQTTRNGRAEMIACERVFKQAIRLWDQIFSDVIEMNEYDELGDDRAVWTDEGNNETGASGSIDDLVEFGNENDAHASVDSPYVSPMALSLWIF